MARWYVARLTGRHPETDRAATLHFDAEHWAGHRPGQHVDVRLTSEDGYQAERSYSIASAPEDPGLDLTVELLDDGEVSGYLVADMAVGDELELSGPIGGWFNWHVSDGGPLLLVGGGSGIVPLMAMLRHRRRQASHVPARLLLSVRTAQDVFYAAELEDLASADDGFDLVITLTRESPPGWTARPGHRVGRIDRAMLAGVAWPVASRQRAFVCGPTAFVESAANALVDLGHPPERIKAERFGPSGIVTPSA